MNENEKLRTLREMARAEFKELDAAVEKLCRRRSNAEAVADAFLDGLASAVEVFVLEPDDRAFAATTREFRVLVRKALMPGIQRRIAAYNKRFPESTATFEQCEREAYETLASVIHPGDMKMLASAEPGQYEACYWPEEEAFTAD